MSVYQPSSPSSHGIAYRPEIDGLRALAVLPVILFHGGFKQFSGGYIGVDIFFVISGYLITSIILKDIGRGRFSIVQFYERRARRILPALFTVLAISLPFAWFLMVPAELVGFGQSLISVILFCSNIFFLVSSNYFDQTAELKPLLHTWSLGVEEQYYILFPIFLFLVYRYGWKTIFYSVSIFAAVSFLCSEAVWRFGHAEENFFFTPSRAWELMAGSLCGIALARQNRLTSIDEMKKNILACIGILLTVVPVFTFDKGTPTPSVYTLIPILGSCLIILYARSENVAGKILSVKGFVSIGLVSYSAYLWHQPIFAYMRLFLGEDFTHLIAVALIALTFLLAYLTWRFIERPFRNLGFLDRRKIFQYSLIGSIIFMSIGGAFIAGKGFISRMPDDQRDFVQYFDMNENGNYVRSRYNGQSGNFSNQPDKRKVLIVGDSFSQDFYNMALEANIFEGDEVRTLYLPARCQIYLGKKPLSEFVDEADVKMCESRDGLKEQSKNISRADIIILIASWRRWSAQSLPETIAALNLRDEQKLIVIGRKSFGSINLRKLMRTPGEMRRKTTSPIDPDYIQINRVMKDNLPDAVFVDSYSIICGEDKICPVFTPEGRLISYDGSHLTKEGAVYIGSLLFKDPNLEAVK